MDQDLRRTPLYEIHKASGARLVPFAGYEMPVQFAGIKAEHNAVRNQAGIFDVSHMGEVYFKGPGALEYVNWLATNDVKSIGDGQALYSPLCKADGTIVDDCIIYRFSATELLIVINASNHDKDVAHFEKHLPPDGVTLTDASYETGQIAIQGPLSIDIMQKAGADDDITNLKPFTFVKRDFLGAIALVSRTGYTGEDGFEIYTSNDHTVKVWESLMEAGKDRGIQPVGLGARDTLRLEAKLCLYGNDIDETTTPLEAGLGWTVKLDAGEFLGSDALKKQKEEGIKRKLVGFRMIDRGIARHGYPVVPPDAGPDAEPMGTVTSGCPSPTLEKNIGLAYVPVGQSKRGTKLGIVIRNRVLKAKVIKTPFYRRKN